MTEPTKAEKDASRRSLQTFDDYISTLGVINEHGDLCKDGSRAVNHIGMLTSQLIAAIEADEGVKAVADELHKSVNRIKQP